MADTYLPKHFTSGADCDVEAEEELNYKLIKLLSTLKTPSQSIPIDYQKTRSLSGTNSDNDTESLLDSASLPGSLDQRRHPYDYSYIHHGSPITSKHLPNFLPPIGVFWDIENCQVPKGRSAIAVTQKIRDKFFNGYKEAEFIVVCDVQKENKQIIQELNDAQVNLIHVAATCKNAADEKLRQSIRRFADIHGSPAAIILISGDINFAADLSDLRHRKKIHVILLHKENTSEALILCANEHYDFTELMEPLPSRTPIKVSESFDLLISNLPEDKDVTGIKRRLKRLSNNCGGRVVEVQSNAAIVRFFSKEYADRAQKRMHGEYVFDSKISVKFLKEKDSSSENNSRENACVREHTLSESEAVNSPLVQMYGANSTIAGARSLPVTPHYHSGSPIVGSYSAWNGLHCSSVNPQTGFVDSASSFIGKCFSYNEGTCNRSHSEHSRVQSPHVWQMTGSQQLNRLWDDHYKDKSKTVGKRVHISQVGDNIIPEGISRTNDGHRRIRGTHGSFGQHSEFSSQRPSWPAPPIHNGNHNTFSQSFKRQSPLPMFSQSQIRDMSHWNGQHQNPLRTARASSPYDMNSVHSMSQQMTRMSPYHHSDAENEEVENFFNPINSRNGMNSSNGTFTPIELQVTNLDQNIDPKDMKRILSSIFMEHVMVLHVSVFMQSDGNFAASVKVPSLHEAQYAISQLHRRKIGYKRILISYSHTGGPNPQLIRSQIVMLLQEVPGHKLPLFKFREMYESRFMISISVSEIYKLKDVCIITEDPGGRMVSLHPDHRSTPSPCFGSSSSDGQLLEFPFCTLHTQKPCFDKGWAEQELASLPNVQISLKILSIRVNQMLSTHNGSLPLPSFPTCYEAEFKESLLVDENGVPLEHLVSCLSTVELKQGVGSVKHLIWTGNRAHDDSHEENKCVSPPLANQLALFSRELVDLLKTAPHCQLSFNRFIPAYHHHFGRQCRVADYGFTKLIELLEALTHTVQVMGEGNKRVVTLSHRAQVRRFTSDLLRVLKAQASKQVTLSEFSSVYARVLGKPWDVVDYGVCDIEDILGEVSENTVVVTNFNGDDQLIAIPKREQTPEEIERTKQFAVEVVELLRHAPQCRMLFNKFVPSYHHHFGHQCRVSDYGFTKLIELFESIPDVVNIEDVSGGERRISLTEKESLLVLDEQISKLIAHSNGSLNVSNVPQAFLQLYGYALRPELFNCNSILQLMEKIDNTVQVIHTETGAVVISLNKSHLQQLALQCRRVLIDQINYSMPVKKFQLLYSQFYHRNCDLEEIKKELSNVVQFINLNDSQHIELTPIQCFACNVYRVLMNYGGSLGITQFESAYLNIIGSACRAAQFGYPTLTALLQSLSCTVILKENRNKKKIVHLNKKLASVGFPLPSTFSTSNQESESGIDSFEMDSSTRLNVSSASSKHEEQSNWTCESGNSSWKQKSDVTNWPKKNTSPWSAMSLNDNLNHQWPSMQSRGDTFLKSLMRTPVLSNEFPPPPPEPENIELHEDDDDDKDKSWKFSIWSSPPNYSFRRNEQFTNFEVPSIPLSTWDEMSGNDEASDLLSPTKNLLSASANPLNPNISPFYSTNQNVIIAPHPSALPRPSVSLTTKKDDLDNMSPTSSMSGGLFEHETADRVDTTPTKRSFSGKRRLAAQFDQPIDP